MKNNNDNNQVFRKPSMINLYDFYTDRCGGKKIIIPANQRPYSWELKQFEDLWKDIMVQKDKSKIIHHYFNMITILPDHINSEIHVYDGQQRITTITLILLFIYKKIKYKTNNNYDHMIKEIEECIFEDDLKTLKLKPTYINKQYLEEIVDTNSEYEFDEFSTNSSSPFAHYKSNENISALFVFLDANLYPEIKRGDAIFVREILDVILYEFDIIIGDMKDTETSYRVFELVNNRGVALSDIDLVKNYFFTCIANYYSDATTKKNKIEDLEQKWRDVIAICREDFEKFIKYEWFTKYSLIFTDGAFISKREAYKNNYFTKSKMDKFGNPNYMYFSIMTTIDSVPSHERVDYIFSFLDSLIKNAKITVQFFELVKNDIMILDDFTNLKSINDILTTLSSNEYIGCSVEDLKIVWAFMKVLNNKYEYLNYFVYFLLTKGQKYVVQKNKSLAIEKPNFDFTANLGSEFQYIMNFYLLYTISDVKDTKTLNNFNYDICGNLHSCHDVSISTLISKFFKFYDIKVSNEEISNGLKTKKKHDTKITKILLMKIDLHEKVKLGSVFDVSLYFDSLNGIENIKHKVNVIECEHFLPQATSKTDKLSTIYYNWGGNLIKEHDPNLFNYLGNYVLLRSNENKDAAEYLENKLRIYVSNRTLYPHINFFLNKIEMELYHSINNVTGNELYHRIIDTYDAIEKKKDFIIKLENNWRNEIASLYEKDDLLCINNYK